jgi:hypothetical protein
MARYTAILFALAASLGSVNGAGSNKAFAPTAGSLKDRQAIQLSVRAGAFGQKKVAPAATKKAAPAAPKKPTPAPKKAAPVPTVAAAPKSNVEKYVRFTATLVLLYSAAFAFAPWDSITDYVYPAFKVVDYEPVVQVVTAALLLGWGIGKYVAYESGPAACKLFCKLNVLPMVVISSFLLSEGYNRDGLVNLALTIGYLYFGFLE